MSRLLGSVSLFFCLVMPAKRCLLHAYMRARMSNLHLHALYCLRACGCCACAEHLLVQRVPTEAGQRTMMQDG